MRSGRFSFGLPADKYRYGVSNVQLCRCALTTFALLVHHLQRVASSLDVTKPCSPTRACNVAPLAKPDEQPIVKAQKPGPGRMPARQLSDWVLTWPGAATGPRPSKVSDHRDTRVPPWTKSSMFEQPEPLPGQGWRPPRPINTTATLQKAGFDIRGDLTMCR